MTFLDVLSAVYDEAGFGASPATAVVTRIKRHVNIVHRQIVTTPGLERLRRGVLTFATVATDPFAVLPQAAVRVFRISDRTNNKALTEVPFDRARLIDPGADQTSGTPDFYAIENLNSPVARQPSDASQLVVKSTAAGDTGTAFLESLITGGYHQTASVTMSGVTGVNLGLASSLMVTNWYLSAAAVGTVTLHEDTDIGTELARIAIGKTRARYSRLLVWPTPTAVVTYHADVEFYIGDLVNDTDEPRLPEDFHWVLVEGALARELRHKDDARSKQARDLVRDGLETLKTRLPMADGLVSLRPQSVGFSQLGPFFERGT